MSKRLGRNQKRKFREEIERLGIQKERIEERLALSQYAGRHDRKAVEMTARILGKYFAGLPPHEIEVRSLEQLCHPFRVQSYRQLESFPQPGVISGKDMMNVLYDVEELQILKGDSLIDPVRGQIHLRFTYRGQAVGYGLSDMFFDGAPPEEVLAPRIAEEMAHQLISSDALNPRSQRNRRAT